MIFKEKFKQQETVVTSESFNKQIFKGILAWDLVFQTMTIVYCILLSDIPVQKLLFSISTGILICILLHTLLFAITSTLITQSISEDLETFYCYETTEKERTKLVKRLMGLPSFLAMAIFTIYIACSFCWVLLLLYVIKIDSESILLSGVMLYLGALISAVYTLTISSEKICSQHVADIVAKGISKVEVEKRHTFGLKSTLIVTVQMFVPLIYISVFIFILAWRAYSAYMTPRFVFPRLALIVIVTTGSYNFLSIILFKRMMKSINNMRVLLSGINRDNLHKVQKAPTSLANEFMYNMYLINTVVDILQKILKESQEISMSVVESSNELSVISRETAVTSLEQNSGVKELLSAMEQTDNLSKNIAEKIGEVSIVAKKTTDNIIDGFEILKQNMSKLDEIKSANDTTVEGIKRLTEKINGISDIVRIINGIADQTNIIAFNAEIEASSAGDIGENFALVANEIRRLTNNTIQSTNEIRKRIVEIQHSSEDLLSSSQNGSNKILAGTKIINELNDRFEELKNSSETMDYASSDIKTIIEQQTTSFAQIVVTLRQIAAAAETFSNSTQKISDSAQNLCLISTNLKNLQPEDMGEYSNEDENTQAEVDAIVASMSKEVK